MKFILERNPIFSGNEFTRGLLYQAIEPSNYHWYTVERGLNDPDHPCIFAKTYKAKRYYSPHNQDEVWLLQDVPGRSMIEIHVANYPSELKGCIALGKRLTEFNEHGVARSREAFNEFMELTKDETEIEIEIRWKE